MPGVYTTIVFVIQSATCFGQYDHHQVVHMNKKVYKVIWNGHLKRWLVKCYVETHYRDIKRIKSVQMTYVEGFKQNAATSV